MAVTRVSVWSDGGEVAVIEVDDPATTSVQALRESIHQRLGTPVDRQELVYRGTTLEGVALLSSFGIRSGMEVRLDLVEEGRAVLVTLPIGGVVTLPAVEADTVHSMKQRLSDLQDVPVCRQTLLFQGVALENHRTVGEVGLFGREVLLQIVPLINITLLFHDGSSVPLQVAQNETVGAIKTTIEENWAIPSFNQCLRLNGLILEAGRTVSDYHIEEETTIVVGLNRPRTMVFLKTLTGETIMVRVDRDDTVASVKRIIEQQERIPVERQRLIFMGEQLNDRHRFLGYRIEQESAVHLVLRTGNSFQIFVEVSPGRDQVHEVLPSDTVADVKAKVQEKLGDAMNQVDHLSFEGRQLEDGMTMTECGVGPNSVLDLILDRNRNTQIFVAITRNDRLSLWVSLEDTVVKVKEAVARRKGIATDVQQLFYTRQRLENDRTLGSYTIEDQHMLHLELIHPPWLQLTICSQDDGKVISLGAPANEKVVQLKQRIEHQEGIPVSRQEVFFAGRELENSSKLWDYGISNKATLDLVCTAESENVPQEMFIFVKTLTGKTVVLPIGPKDTILDLKQKIESKEGIASAHQCLVSAGKPLDNSHGVSECNIQNQSVLHLVLRVPSQPLLQLTVIRPDGSAVNLEAEAGDTVDSVKDRALEDSSEGHVVFLEGMELQGDRALGSYNINESSTLHIQLIN